MRTITGCTLLLAIAFALAPAAAPAAEADDACTGFIDAVPAVISQAGVWCLRKDLASGIIEGDVITVGVNNVTIDCNDFKLGGLAAGDQSEARGIYSNRSGVTIRNCTIRGFHHGILLQGDGGNHLIERNRLQGNLAFGISVSGDASVVRDNLVLETGGSPIALDGWGIVAYGTTHLEGNTIASVVPEGDGLSPSNANGIYVDGSHGGSIVGNRINKLAPLRGATGVGILVDGSTGVLVRGNHAVAPSNGSLALGIVCSDASSVADGNLLSGFVAASTGCADHGNFVAP